MSATVHRGGIEEDWLDRLTDAVSHPYVVGVLLILCGMVAGVLVSSPRVSAGTRASHATVSSPRPVARPVSHVERVDVPTEAPTIAVTAVEEKTAKHRAHRHKRHRVKANPERVIEQPSETVPKSEHWESPDPSTDGDKPNWD